MISFRTSYSNVMQCPGADGISFLAPAICSNSNKGKDGPSFPLFAMLHNEPKLLSIAQVYYRQPYNTHINNNTHPHSNTWTHTPKSACHRATAHKVLDSCRGFMDASFGAECEAKQDSQNSSGAKPCLPRAWATKPSCMRSISIILLSTTCV